MGKSSTTTRSATRRCIVTARLHDHQGPMYGIILNDKDGMATVEMKDTLGEKLVLSNVPMNCLDMGDEVTKGYTKGKVMEYRYRYYLVPQKVIKNRDDENTVDEENSWRVGQVESVFMDVDGDFMMKFRSRKTEPFLISEASDFIERCIPVKKMDYLLGVGDKCKNMSAAEIRNIVEGCDRTALRERKRSSEKHVYLSPVGEWIYTTLGKEMPLEAARSPPANQSQHRSGESDRRSESGRKNPGSESDLKNAKKNSSQDKGKSRRMRTNPDSGRSPGRRHGKSASVGSDGDNDKDGWNGPTRTSDIEEAGYGNTIRKENQYSYGPKEDKGNYARRMPLRESQERGNTGSSGGGRGNGGMSRGNSNQGRGGGPNTRRVHYHKDGNEDGDSEGGKSWNREERSEPSATRSKHEFLPRQGARARHEVIFRESALLASEGTPGARLEMILQNERHNTPGFTLGHAAALYGFDFGIQPVPIWDIRNAGGGQLRKVEEANTNKAIITSMKLMEARLTSMSQIINVCYNLAAIWGRWYKPQLLEIALILDQEIRAVTIVEGWDAPQAIVDSYVALLEGILGELANALSKVTLEGFNEVMMKEIDRVKTSLTPSSRLHRATVYQAHQKVFGEAFGRKKRGGDRLQEREEHPKKKAHKVDGKVDQVPSHVVDALKVDGKSLCVGFVLDRGCTRAKDKCRFIHAKLPDNLDQKVLDWIKGQNTKKSQ